MKTPNIERNKLDYILTDLLPVEITELFSLNHFYNYLMDNRHILVGAEKGIRETIEDGNKLPFEKGWATMPLKFNILKGNDGQREISLMQPLSMLNIYLFLEFYQKEILLLLKEKSFFPCDITEKITISIIERGLNGFLNTINLPLRKLTRESCNKLAHILGLHNTIRLPRLRVQENGNN